MCASTGAFGPALVPRLFAGQTLDFDLDDSNLVESSFGILEGSSPIVIGAEPVKVLGPVHIGDLLVSSNVPGYAMVAESTPTPGTVIGKALGDFNGEQGLISAMILNH